MSTFTLYAPVGLNGKLSAALFVFAPFLILYAIGLAVYRLFLSPLAGFPGPKIAAVTGWYEFFYDYWCNGKYIFEIEKMHQKYGL